MADALLEYRKQLEPLREALREADSLGRAAPLEDAERLRRRLKQGSSTLDRLIEDGQAGKVPLEESDLKEAKKLRSEVKSHRTKLRNRINKRKQLDCRNCCRSRGFGCRCGSARRCRPRGSFC